jgi:hypothetical protein
MAVWGLADPDLRSYFIGLPNKFHDEPSNRLPIPCQIHGVPPRTKFLGVYATPKTNTLKSLFLLLFNLIFTGF